MSKTVKYGMVGGALHAFIGNVHRHALAINPEVQLVAGCFSTHEEANCETGRTYQLNEDRIYSSFTEMAEKETLREDKMDFVVIVTPNHVHYEVAKAFLTHGFSVVCEKPLCFEVWQAKELERLAKEKGLLFCVTYVYSGNVMMKLARQLVQDNKIGRIINVNAEYPQEWLIDELGAEKDKINKLSTWRKEPSIAGISNCVGDIGTHIEHSVAYITGLHIKRLLAKVDRFEQELDLNANILLEYSNGAHGLYWCSQVAVGKMNALVLRIYGTEGSIEWEQENPNQLKLTYKGQPTQILNRGMAYVYGRAAQLTVIPSGHPEGYFEAFANIYKTFVGALLKKKAGENLTEDDLDFPTVFDGIRGVQFIHSVIESSDGGGKWVEVEAL